MNKSRPREGKRLPNITQQVCDGGRSTNCAQTGIWHLYSTWEAGWGRGLQDGRQGGSQHGGLPWWEPRYQKHPAWAATLCCQLEWFSWRLLWVYVMRMSSWKEGGGRRLMGWHSLLQWSPFWTGPWCLHSEALLLASCFQHHYLPLPSYPKGECGHSSALRESEWGKKWSCWHLGNLYF